MLIVKESPEASIIYTVKEVVSDPFRRAVAIEDAVWLRVRDLAYRTAALEDAGGARRTFLRVQRRARKSAQADRAAGTVVLSVQLHREKPIRTAREQPQRARKGFEKNCPAGERDEKPPEGEIGQVEGREQRKPYCQWVLLQLIIFMCSC